MKNLKKTYQKLLKNRSSRTAVFAGLSIIAAGSIWAVFSISPSADTATTASFQAEAGTKTGNITTVSDATAAGGNAIKFGTTSTGGFQANCIVKPSDCGYPDATNTGVPAGTTLTRVPEDATSGPGWDWRSDIRAVQIGDTGAVVSNLKINNGFIIVYSGNVTIRNVHIISPGMYPIDCDYGGATRASGGCLGLTIEDSEIQGTSLDCLVGIAFNTYTARRVNVHGCQDGFKADKNVLIEDSYVHSLFYYKDPVTGEDTHNDGVQTTGGSNVTLRHNTIKLGDIAGANAVVQFGTEWGTPNSNWTIDNNLMDGGGWVLNANAPIANMVIKNNRFTKRYGYGIGHIDGATWTGNYYDDNGAAVN